MAIRKKTLDSYKNKRKLSIDCKSYDTQYILLTFINIYIIFSVCSVYTSLRSRICGKLNDNDRSKKMS